MPLTLANAMLVHLDPPQAAPGALRIEGERIVALGPEARPAPGDEVIDCGGAVVMPGLVNGHTHLYSALAVGMPPPSREPKNFLEILELVWWRLDRALDAESIEASAAVGALDALKCGTTTLIDHHASPDCIAHSLDCVERGVDAVGLRAVLCYETTDRHGPAGAEAGLAENRRYLAQCAKRTDHRFAAMVGAHAAFTLSDETLSACAALAAEHGRGVHIHVAEDPCDDALCRQRYGAPLLQRLERSGILDGGAVSGSSILAHGTHLSSAEVGRVCGQVAALAHNPRSNMNNRVGYAPIAQASRVQLGTDGIGGDLFTEARLAWFKARDARARVTPTDVLAMLAHAARTASGLLGDVVGRLAPDAMADCVVTDYVPATPLSDGNVAGHLLFALGPQHVRDVLISGRWVLRDRRAAQVDEATVRRRAADVARKLWERLVTLC